MLKDKIRNHQLTLGSWITIGSPAIAEILANAGFDWLVVDLEHSTIDIATAGELIRTISLCGTTPLVRLTSNDPNQIKRVMDAGAHGIVVPMVNSAEDAKLALNSVHYAPDGQRGVGLARAQKYGVNFDGYMKWLKNESIVIVQIEHIDAVRNLDEILTVPGVDGFIIGPYDLSCSMGIPGEFDSPEFIAILEKINDAGRRTKCPAGLHIVEPDLLKLEETIEKGYTFVAYSVDFRMLDVSARLGISKLREFIS